MKQFCYLVFAICLTTSSLQAQGLTEDDYARAVSFMHNNYNNKTAFNLHTSVNWFKNGSGLWFVDYSKRGSTYKTVAFKKNKVQVLFDHDKLANALNTFLEKKVESNAMSISGIERTENGNLTIKISGKTYALNVKTHTLLEIEEDKKEDPSPFESKSPDGKWIAYTKNYNLYIKSTQTDLEHQLSFKGKKGYEYASWYGWYDLMEGENGERPKRFYVDWSEDSK